MSRKVLGALAVMAGCGFALLAMLPTRGLAPFESSRARASRGSGPVSMPPGVVDAALESRVRSAMRSRPLEFEANLGQTDERVKFTARGSGYVLFLTPEAAVVELHRPFKREKKPIYLEEQPQGWHEEEPLRAVVSMKFIGARPGALLTGLDEQATRTNYLIGTDASRWRRNVPNYRRVKYESLYPGVDAVFYGDRGALEYDFIVKPGTDPGVIKLGFEGVRSLELTNAGEVLAETAAGSLRLLPPHVYQETAGGARVPVAGSYVRRSQDEIGFELGAYDSEKKLVIDPPMTPTGSALQLGTYFGGDGDDAITAIAVGTNGQVYIAGYSDNSTGFPPTTGFQTTLNGAFDCSQFPQHPCGDAFVATLNTTTGGLVVATFLGGSGDDVAWGLALDGTNDPYIVGESDSGDFPTTASAFQTGPAAATCSSGSRTRPCRHVFFTKMDPALSMLKYSTLIGGLDDDSGFAVAINSTGQAILTGVAGFGFPAGGTYTGGGDGFVANVDPTKSGAASLVFAQYFGGSSTDAGLSVALDTMGNIFVGGATFSTISGTLFPTTPGAVQAASVDTASCGPGVSSNCGDGFVTEFDPAGVTLYSTFLGGAGTDQVNGIAVDSTGKVYVTGATVSSASGFPTTAGAFNTAGSGGFDVFASKIDPTKSGLAGLVYSTFIPGSNDDMGDAIIIDAVTPPNAYIAGTTMSADFPIALPLQAATRNFALNTTAFVTSVNGTGTALNFSTYYGGSTSETGRAIALDSSGKVYAGGGSNSVDLCVPSAFQPHYDIQANQPTDGFLTIINPTNTASACVQFASLPFIAPGPIDYGFINVGTSFGQTVNLFNAGSNVMTFTTPITGPNASDFAESDTCAGMVAGGSPAGPCGLLVTFKPTAAGGTTETATMTINTSGLIASTVVNLMGVALGPAPVAVTPMNTTFLPEVVGTTQAPMFIKISNTGTFNVNRPLTVSNVALGGTNPGDFAIAPLINFSQGTPCFFGAIGFPVSVFPGQSCVFAVTFTPTAQIPSPRTATVTVTDDGTTAMQAVNVSGPVAAANGPNINFQGPLSFGPVQQGTTSPAQTLTITNTGGAPMTVMSVAASANFAISTNTCSPSVPLTPSPAAGSTCTVMVTFTPPGTGPFLGTLTITDTAPGSPHMVALNGTGTPPNSPNITVSNGVNFGQQVLNTTSAAQMVNITSSGTAALTINSVSASGDFAASAGNCPLAPTTLAVGNSCQATVTFTPTGLGARIGSLSINDTAPGSPQMVGLTGQGINNGGPGVSLSGPLSFGPVLQNTTSPAQMVTLTNNGVAALSIMSIAPSGDYAEGNTCPIQPATLAVGGMCTISVTFTPTALGTRNGAITIMDNAAGSPHVISLTGVGTSPAGGPVVSLGAPLFFGPVPLNTPSATQTVMLTNTGGAPLTFTGAGITTTGDFSQMNTCGAGIGIGAMCTITVTFTPTVLGARMGTLSINDNAPGSPQTVGLSGTGVTFTINVSGGAGVSATVVPGQSAQYSLTITPSPGFVGTVTFSCGGNPPTTICTVSPSMATLGNGMPVTLIVTVRTNCVTILAPRGPVSPPALPPQLFALWLAALVALALARKFAPATRVARLAPAMAVLLLVGIWAACSAGSSVINVPGQPQTPTGTYNIIVTGSSSPQNQQSINLTLRVV